MRQELDIASQQLDALSNYLAFVPRDPSLPLSVQIARDAAAGEVWARRVMHSRVLESPQSAEVVSPVDRCAPLPSVAVGTQSLAVLKQAQNATHRVMTGMQARRRRRSVGMLARRAAQAQVPAPFVVRQVQGKEF
jgi:hypothetical protein